MIIELLQALADAQSSIQGLGNKFGVVSLELGKVRAILSNVVFLEQARQFGGTAEFERFVAGGFDYLFVNALLFFFL